MTDRVRAGYTAAVALAEADPDRPDVLEATLRLGHMEGTWAAIFGRRDALHVRVAADVAKAWGALVDDVDVDELVGDAEDTLAAAGDDGQTRTAAVTTVTGHALTALRALTATTGWEALRTAVADGVAAGHAEGAANAAALSADRAGGIGFDHDTAHADALTAVAGRADVTSAADTALHLALAATSGIVARRLVRGVLDGDNTDGLTRVVVDNLTDAAAVTAEAVHAVETAMSASMWRLYQVGGVSQVRLVTVGDGRECAPCVRAEDAGPYDLFDAPILPRHHGCRCVLDAVGTLPASLYSTYLA
jgi:hypothetical protein